MYEEEEDFGDEEEEKVKDPEDDEESTLDTEDVDSMVDRKCPEEMFECPSTGDCIEEIQRSGFLKWK